MNIFSDDFLRVDLSDQPATLGHLLVYPLKGLSFEEMSHEQVAHTFTVASICSSILFEGLQAQGTNIIASDGKSALLSDEVSDRFCVHVIPRKQDDGLQFLWEMKQGDKGEVARVASAIREHMFFGNEATDEVIDVPVVEDGSVAEHERDLRIDDLMKRF